MNNPVDHRPGEVDGIVDDARCTILLVEQDVLTAFELADHAYVVETGRNGATSALADDPRIRQGISGCDG
jgi:ABC-type branched-subunit amino acid transport system ATPase component